MLIALRRTFSVNIYLLKLSVGLCHYQVTCVTLLDSSAAFDTIDHYILLERLSSWFSIFSTALSRIKSYFLNRSFYVNIKNSKSSVFQLLYGVHHHHKSTYSAPVTIRTQAHYKSP